MPVEPSVPSRLRVILRKLASLPIRARQVYLALMGTDRGTQLLLRHQHQQAFSREGKAMPFDEVEFRSYSQNGEDGILWYVFSLIGSTNRRCVEICAGSGYQCNSANLILNHGWIGLLFDGNAKLIERARMFYATHPDSCAFPPRMVHSWITTENINSLIESNGMTGDIDLLSLDMDGIDYWIWETIDVIRPRVVIAEVQIILGAEASLSAPNDANFKAEFKDGCGIYCGASMTAFVKLARKKGYRLIGCQRYGFNALFMRDDVGTEIFPEVTAQSCFEHDFARWAQDRFLPLVKDKPWVEV